MLMRISERVLESNSSVLLFTICFMFTASLSSGWSLQMAPGSCALFRSDIAFLLEKTAGKDILDPMNFHSDIGRRKPSNFRDGGRVHVLQMRNHDLPVQRFELPDEPRELLQRSLAIDVRLAILARRGPLDLFEPHKSRVLPALPVHVRNSGVVSHPKRPRLQRAPSVKNLEASPELKVDILPEIVTLFRVCFVSGGQPVQRAAKLADGGRV